MTHPEIYEYLKANDMILFQGIVGSNAFGTVTPDSDIDRCFVYIQPFEDLLGDNIIPQLNVIGDDFVGYEVSRYIELLAASNPDKLNLMNLPEDCIEICHPMFRSIFIENRQLFLSKKCMDSHANYAVKQVRKAKGLNKKIMNPMDKKKKSIIDFCWTSHNQGSILIEEFLEQRGLKQEDCGLSAIPHMKNCYHVFHSVSNQYKGIIQDREKSMTVSLSSISKGETPLCVMYFNLEGYSTYCKEYKEYWEWVEESNKERFIFSEDDEYNYNAKNMMHCYRLIETAIDIAEKHELIVRRPNRDFLLTIKTAKYKYSDILKESEELIIKMEQAYKISSLPDDLSHINFGNILTLARMKFYGFNTPYDSPYRKLTNN